MAENPVQIQQPKPPTPDLLIRGHELEYFDDIIGQFPTKFGYKVIQFFQAVGQAREQERVKAEQAQAAIDKTNNEKAVKAAAPSDNGASPTLDEAHAILAKAQKEEAEKQAGQN